jgi:hypothetical protein
MGQAYNVTAPRRILISREWEAVGYALPDFDGRPVPYVFPGMGRGVRAGVDVLF